MCMAPAGEGVQSPGSIQSLSPQQGSMLTLADRLFFFFFFNYYCIYSFLPLPPCNKERKIQNRTCVI